jgi:hypothetical protein
MAIYFLFHLMFFRFRQEKQYLKAISVSLANCSNYVQWPCYFFLLLRALSNGATNRTALIGNLQGDNKKCYKS